jgi:hypothetical protein
MTAAAIRLYPAVCVFIIPKTEAFNAYCLLWGLLWIFSDDVPVIYIYIEREGAQSGR